MKLENAIRECFEYCFNTPVHSDRNVFSALMNSLPAGYRFYYPLQVSWKLTSSCNLRCSHCFYYTEKDRFFNSSADLTKDEAMQIITNLIDDVNIMAVSLTGGEILLCPYFWELLKFIKSKNVCVNLITNGTLIDKKIAAKLSSILNFKYDSIQISLDGASASVHDSIRGQGSFEKTCTALKILADFNIPVRIATAVIKKNVFQLGEFGDFCKKFKIKEIALNRYKTVSDEQRYLMPETEELFKGYALLLENLDRTRLDKNFFYVYDFLKYEYGRFLFDTENPPAKFGKDKLCHSHSKFHLAPDGKIYLCTSAECAGLCLGDLRKNSFDEIWQGRFSNPLFKQRLIKNLPCSECRYEKWCRCGCAVESVCRNGIPDAPTEECCFVKGSKEYDFKT